MNRGATLPPLVVTFVSMGVGSVLMLITGLVFQGSGTLSVWDWVIIAWMAVINTALAFTLWNRSLQVLTAVECIHPQQPDDASNCHPGFRFPG